MAKKFTNALEHIWGQTSTTDIEEYLTQYADSLLTEEHPFSAYMHEMMIELSDLGIESIDQIEEIEFNLRIVDEKPWTISQLLM